MAARAQILRLLASLDRMRCLGLGLRKRRDICHIKAKRDCYTPQNRP